jgi:hypothetical protein
MRRKIRKKLELKWVLQSGQREKEHRAGKTIKENQFPD